MVQGYQEGRSNCQPRVLDASPPARRVGRHTRRAIGYVATHPDHRHQGLAGTLIQDWTLELTRRGEHLSYVTGIPRFYEQFGYEPSFPMDLRDAPVILGPVESLTEEGHLKARPYRSDDLPSLVSLYQEENRRRTGSLVRTPEYWDWLVQGLHASGRVKQEDIWVAEDSAGRSVGYVFLRPGPQNQLEIWEAAALTREVAFGLLRAVIARMTLEGKSSIELKLPLDHRMTMAALGSGARLSGYSYAIKGRLLNLVGLLEALRPELVQRLQGSAQAEWQGTIGLVTDVGSIDLAVADGEIEIGGGVAPLYVLEIPQSLLIQLVTGYASVHWVAGALNARRMAGYSASGIDRNLWPVLEALFPKGCPYIWNADIGY